MDNNKHFRIYFAFLSLCFLEASNALAYQDNENQEALQAVDTTEFNKTVNMQKISGMNP